MCKHSRRSRRPHWRNFIRSAEHAHRGKEPNYLASVDSELPPYAGGRPCLQGSTRSFPGAGGRARATYSCLPQLLTSSRSFLGSSAERRRGNRLSCGPAPRHRQGRPLAEQLGSLARAPPATAAWFRLPPYRPGGCRGGNRPAARANRARAFRRRTAGPSRPDRALPDAGNPCTKRSTGRGPRQRCRASSAGRVLTNHLSLKTLALSL